MRVIPSAVLRDASTASKRYENADAEMRRHHPNPPDKVVREWNSARRAAEIASQVVLSASQD